MKKILMLTTGGTISCENSSQGLSPKRKGDEFLSYLSLPSEIRLEVEDLFQLDSTNIQPEHWESLSGKIEEKMEQYDGFVITHGTDTMAYTSSMLSYLFCGAKKPIVLTGSQLPIDVKGSDGPGNLQDAILVASELEHPGVFVVFCGHIFYGARVHKDYTKEFDAFLSPNAPEVGRVQYHQNVVWETYTMPLFSSSPSVSLTNQVFYLKLVPGLKKQVLSMALALGYRGIVIEAFGTGNIPFSGENLAEEIQKISARIPVVICTQCLHDGVDLSLYSTGQIGQKAGVISAGDMTCEAAYTKLVWALGKSKKIEEIREMFQTSYCHEIT